MIGLLLLAAVLAGLGWLWLVVQESRPPPSEALMAQAQMIEALIALELAEWEASRQIADLNREHERRVG